VPELKVRVLNKIKIKTTSSENNNPKRHPSPPYRLQATLSKLRLDKTPRQGKAQRHKGKAK